MSYGPRQLFAKLLSLFRNRKLDREFQDELSTHVDMAIEDNMRRGMSREEARRRALIRLGGIEPTRELHRESRSVPFLETVAQDIIYSFRMLRRDAGLTTFAILIVGLGVGASSSVFSVVNALLLKPLPFAQPQQLTWIANSGTPGLSGETVQVDHLRDLEAQNQSFSEVAAYFAFYKQGDNKLTGSGEPERLTGVPVTQNFFPMLGIAPQLGRVFSVEDCRWGAPRTVLLSHGFWERRFASDPNVVGRTVTLNDSPTTIIGVMPESFDFATVFAPGIRMDLYRPFPLSPETNRWGNTMSIIGRLKPGVTPQAAQADLSNIAARLSKDNPRRNSFRPLITPLRQHVSGQLRRAVIVLACAVGLVMLIVCANLSNLLLARTATREREIAIRAALGADRRRLIRQLLTESLVLAFAGAALGLVLAVVGTRLLSRLNAVRIPLLEHVQVDGWALGFTLLTAVLTGVAFGLAPALRISRLSLHESLKDNSRGSSGKRQGGVRAALVVCEVAFACMLLVGAGLLVRSFLRVLDTDLGFEPQRAAALRVDPGSRYPTQALRNAYFDDVLARARTVPGVQAVGLTDSLPYGTNRSWGVGAKGKTYDPSNYPEAFVRIVSAGFISALGIALDSGRDFTEADNPASPRVIIINATMARALWPGEDPLGKVLKADGERQVIGVVKDVRHLTVEEASGNEMYLPIKQTSDYSSVDLVVRSSSAQAGLAAGLRETLRTLDPNLPANEFRTIQDLVERSTSPRRLIVMLLAGFAVFALILASLGIYGVISYSVNQRRKEIGIRKALGASASNLHALVLSQTLKLAAVGMVLGLAASWPLGVALQSMLFGVTPLDPVSFSSALILLLGVAALAGYLPARRAASLNPVEALRGE